MKTAPDLQTAKAMKTSSTLLAGLIATAALWLIKSDSSLFPKSETSEHRQQQPDLRPKPAVAQERAGKERRLPGRGRVTASSVSVEPSPVVESRAELSATPVQGNPEEPQDSRSKNLREQQLLIQRLVADHLRGPRVSDPAFIKQLPGRSLKRFAVETLAREWARQDIDAVWNWLERMEDPNLQAAAVSGVVWNLAQQDFEATTSWISEMEPSPLRDAAALKAAKLLAIQRPADAVKWATEFPGESLQHAALTFGLHHWVSENLPAAAKWAIEHDDADLQSKALPMIAAAWANQDPAVATRWVAEFPVNLRGQSLEETTRRWLQKAPEEAESWMAANLTATTSSN